MSNLVLPKIRWSVTGLTERQRGGATKAKAQVNFSFKGQARKQG